MAGKKAKKNRYTRVIEAVFFDHYKAGKTSLDFHRDELAEHCRRLNIEPPKNLGDIVYSFRYRNRLPEKIEKSAPDGCTWVIRPAGRAKYRFEAVKSVTEILPSPLMLSTKIPDATPGVISKYALGDEQALLAKLRYNRLIDVFSKVTCYSLQNHLRSTVKEMGQVETDEIYVGIDKSGAHYVFPIQAKGGRDKLNIVQIMQDIALCAEKFPLLICRPIAAQFVNDSTIVLFEFQERDGVVGVVCEKHYQLVPFGSVTDEDLQHYRSSIDSLD